LFRKSKKTVGIRIPDHGVPAAIVEALGRPLVVSSVVQDDDVIEYLTDAELVHEKYSKRVDAVIQGGIGNNEPSTVIDCTSGEAEVLREGRGVIEGIL
jgi:tRNA A37 threonylcarbamoyladenosine synthetase subunit TsaC/SUA5/YrdC